VKAAWWLELDLGLYDANPLTGMFPESLHNKLESQGFKVEAGAVGNYMLQLK
jgi:hypothetical protein